MSEEEPNLVIYALDIEKVKMFFPEPTEISDFVINLKELLDDIQTEAENSSLEDVNRSVYRIISYLSSFFNTNLNLSLRFAACFCEKKEKADE